MNIVRLTPDDWAIFRDVRLEALADAPFAFSTRLATEAHLDEPRWRAKLETRAQFVARDDPALSASRRAAIVVGTAGAYRDGDSMQLISMWVAPAARQRGVGAALVERVVDHARESGSRCVVLRVRIGNDAAERLYERLGFVRSSLQVDVDDGGLEAEMVKAL